MTALLPTYILDPHSVAVSQFKNVDRVLFIHHLYLGYLRYGSSRVCNEAMIVDGDYFRLFPETVRIWKFSTLPNSCHCHFKLVDMIIKVLNISYWIVGVKVGVYQAAVLRRPYVIPTKMLTQEQQMKCWKEGIKRMINLGWSSRFQLAFPGSTIAFELYLNARALHVSHPWRRLYRIPTKFSKLSPQLLPFLLEVLLCFN